DPLAPGALRGRVHLPHLQHRFLRAGHGELAAGAGRGHRPESLTKAEIFRGLSQMSDSGDLAAWIELSLVPGLGSARIRSLLSAFGLPSQVLSATRAQLSRVVPEALAAGVPARRPRPHARGG